MINYKFLEISEALRDEYNGAFKSQNDRQIFSFFRNFLKFIENDDAPYNRTFILENPFNKTESIKFLAEFNQNCYNFLHMKICEDGKKEPKWHKAEAYTYIGAGYEYGIFNFQQNSKYAFENYTISAQLHSELGTFMLAQCHENGTGTHKNSKRALCFYRCAAKLGLPDAMHAYGNILYHGYVGSEKDQKTGFYYLKTASEKSSILCPYPLYDLGMYYSSPGEANEIRDPIYAAEIFQKGAEYGDPNCQFKLGQAYEFGDMGLDKNIQKSIEYYTAAAENGHVDAQLTMSSHCLEGLCPNVQKSHQKSFMWALRAASKGEANATYILGEYAETGTGTRKDILYALFFYKISEKLGNKRAVIKIEKLNRDISRRDNGTEIPARCCSFLCF